MATSKRPGESDEEEIQAPAPAGKPTIHDKIAAFTMLDGMKDKTQAERCMRLHLVGFTNPDIATMLQTSPAVVATNLYGERKKAVKKVAARKAGPVEEVA
jgi:hypothetical protein